MGKIINTNTIDNKDNLDGVLSELKDQSTKLEVQRTELVLLKNELKLNNFYNGMAADTIVNVDDIINDNAEE